MQRSIDQSGDVFEEYPVCARFLWVLFNNTYFFVVLCCAFKWSSHAHEARVGQSLILIEYGQSLFIWYASTDCKGGVGETIKREGGVSQVCLGKSTSCILDIHKMVN